MKVSNQKIIISKLVSFFIQNTISIIFFFLCVGISFNYCQRLWSIYKLLVCICKLLVYVFSSISVDKLHQISLFPLYSINTEVLFVFQLLGNFCFYLSFGNLLLYLIHRSTLLKLSLQFFSCFLKFNLSQLRKESKKAWLGEMNTIMSAEKKIWERIL